MDNNENMEQWNDVKEKKSNTIIIILLVIIIVILGGLVFIKRDVIFNKEESKNKTEQKEEKKNTVEEETVTFTDSELEKYVNYIQQVNIGPSPSLYNREKVVASELSAREKIEYIGQAIYEKSTPSNDYSYDIIAEEDVKKLVEEVYGPNTYEPTTFKLSCGDYTLRDDNKYYTKTGCGGTSMIIDKNVIIDYKATKSKLEITTAYAFVSGTSDDQIFKDFELKNSIGTCKGNDNLKECLTSFIKSNPDKVNHIIYTFESTDGHNYYFKEFTNSK